ncbi:hypothetical protein ACIQYZ_13545 [Rhodococcus erythropolis]
MATEAERRLEQVDAERVAEIRRMLEQPGGSDEVAKKFGKAELATDEFKTARRQRQEAQTRRREAAEAREREAEKQRAAARTQAQDRSRPDRSSDAVDLRSKLKEGRKDLAAADKRSQQQRGQSRSEVYAQTR